MGTVGRTVLIVWAMFLIAGFALARSLEPDNRGFGTHQQMGLPECTFRLVFSKPCPGCGMTTSFAHFVRGEFSAAARANETALLLAMISAMMIPWSLSSAARGRLWFVDDPVKVFAGLILVLGGISVAMWLIRNWIMV